MNVILMVFTDGETEAMRLANPRNTVGREVEARTVALVASLTRPVGPGSGPTVTPKVTSVRHSPLSLPTLQVELTSSKWMQSSARR